MWRLNYLGNTNANDNLSDYWINFPFSYLFFNTKKPLINSKFKSLEIFYIILSNIIPVFEVYKNLNLNDNKTFRLENKPFFLVYKRINFFSLILYILENKSTLITIEIVSICFICFSGVVKIQKKKFFWNTKGNRECFPFKSSYKDEYHSTNDFFVLWSFIFFLFCFVFRCFFRKFIRK